MSIHDRIPEGLRDDPLVNLHRIGRAEIPEPYCTRRTTKDGRVLDVWITATALMNESGQMVAIATMEQAKKMGI
ncbi:MAG: hypothetical protein AB7S77_09365 [Desulfatirhabdiaceae bacterium]